MDSGLVPVLSSLTSAYATFITSLRKQIASVTRLQGPSEELAELRAARLTALQSIGYAVDSSLPCIRQRLIIIHKVKYVTFCND